MSKEENRRRNTSHSSRDKYRDNDDVRDPIAAEDRVGTKPDTRFEARGDARENVGNTAHPHRENPDEG